MNPLIVCQKPIDGVIEVSLAQPCPCYIALLSAAIPSIKRPDDSITEIHVSCDQVDATLNNRKRLLAVFGYGKNRSGQWTRYDFCHVLYHKIDSSEKKLTFRIYDKHGPVVPEDSDKNSENIILNLNMIPTKTSRKL